MATTLTTSYKKIATINLTYGKIFTYARYTSQNRTTNTTTYQIKSTYYTTQGNGVNFSSATAKLDGTTKSYGYTTMKKGETTIQELTRTLNHNNDGSSPTKTISTSWDATYGGDGTSSASIVAPKINRIATLTSAPNFNDEQNPTITYSNPAGTSVTTLKAGIYATNGYTAYASYRDISKTGTSYTFNLTEAERTALRNAIPNSNSMTVRFYVQTVIGGSTYTSILARTLSIINANPTFTYTKAEQNNSVITYLGSSATSVVQNASTIRFTATPTAYKSATINRFEVINGTNTLTAQSPYQIDIPITASTTTLRIVDSRGNVATETFEPTFIEYQNVKPNSFSFKRVTPTSSNVVLTLDSVYYQQTFGNTANVPVVKWKLDDGDWNTISSSEYTIDTQNHNLKINYTINNAIDYRDAGTFYVEVSDLLSSWTNSNVVSKGIPVMEWGDDEVQINGDLYLADANRDNVVKVGVDSYSLGTDGYIRYKNGFQIAWVKYTFTGNFTLWGGSIYYLNSGTLPNWPKAFTEVYYQNIQTDITFWTATTYPTTTKPGMCRLLRVNGQNNASIDATIVAFGKWTT